MAITVADNFSYQGKKPLDGRDGFDTLAQMKAYPEASVYDGCMTYCKEDEKYYTFKGSNTVDVTTGKWREFETGGGGQTYNDFTGATASTAGAHGLVPAPSAGDEGKVLFGNGLWGALPSVDLSVLSNEAFILSATEKAVGQDKSGKLLYAKTVEVSSAVTIDSNNWATIANFSGMNIDKMRYCWVYYLETGGSYSNLASCFYEDSSANLKARLNLNANFTMQVKAGSLITVFYTKTTDSPLPAGVKFAGVTASGEVIYKRSVTGLSINLNWSGDKFASASFSPLFSGVDKFIGMTAYDADGCHTGSILKDGNNWEIRALGAITITSLTILYTLAS